ncbi:MAG: phosphodiester glycosidase family protein [Deltaproteobacteria bacterium]|nr:phosphodiester glycosidase family protein [Deltaproteobacteria bacterium]
MKFLFSILVFLFSFSAFAQENLLRPPAQHEWRALSQDLEILELGTDESGIFSSKVLFLRSALKQHRVVVTRAKDFSFQKATVRALAKKQNAVLTINANFFDPKSNPLGIVVHRGIVFNNLHRGGNVLTGVFQVKDTGLSIIPRNKFSLEGILEAVQSGPRLIYNGREVDGLKQSQETSRRAGVCIDNIGRVVFFCTNSGFIGLSLEQLQKLLLRPEIQCKDALNLDGGGSAQMYIKYNGESSQDQSLSLFIPGRDEVPVALSLIEKEDA